MVPSYFAEHLYETAVVIYIYTVKIGSLEVLPAIQDVNCAMDLPLRPGVAALKKEYRPSNPFFFTISWPRSSCLSIQNDLFFLH